ncbi:ADENYLATE KINASE 8 [Salix koriyanagi]|uniref:adenylate kinase n=1 Tax=Salix koriyanagi TaxID=2511006 RepID=A0A9Q1A8V9_9ROSI|nr:ADENYLATE KINASE 8 [Salix koriyanagi]
MMVMEGLLLPDSQENGWLLDGCPRSLSQATALKEFGLQPDLFILLEVNEEILVERVVGRRLDPATGSEDSVFFVALIGHWVNVAKCSIDYTTIPSQLSQCYQAPLPCE